VSAPVTPAPTVDTTTVVAPTSTEPVPTQERQNEGPSRITVHALSNSWIQVRDEVADRLLFTRLLRRGDEYKVPNRSGLRLMTGNAGALELRVDDVAAPSIGAVGEVRRSVELDVDKLKAGTAVSE
jgi:cytoskeleton protein RodZ